MLGEILPVDATPEEFELCVLEWVKRSNPGGMNFEATHLKILHGDSGDYEIDILVTFEFFQGAEFKTLIECKKYGRAIEREKVMVLCEKVKDSNAHKGMLVASSGFQSGAIEFAQKRGIALVTFQNGDGRFITKSEGSETAQAPNGVHVSKFQGHFMTIGDRGFPQYALIDDKYISPLVRWFGS